MPKRTDLKKIMVIGSGPIVIGQACEFDYSGTQGIKALKEEGYEVVLVNSNPATIMTDPGLADRTYIEPIEPETVAAIVRKERPCAILPTLGGQTGLNTALALAKSGVLAECGTELIGARAEVIEKAESRELFRQAMENIGLKVPQSAIAHNMDDVRRIGSSMPFPMIIRPAFTLGGTGGGIAYNMEDLEEIAGDGLTASPVSEVMIEQSVIGWKEFEMEVMRDTADNCVIVCSIENVDAMGVHTGDSITVAPAQTLTDREYQKMRDASLAIMREIGVETGGSNVQFGVNPANGELVIIEMNPRVSRSSALASKATGFPIAKIAAKLAVGYTLDELRNDITRETSASFEPTIDYCVVKIPRFTFEKFPGAKDELTTSMKSVGETMAIGRTFKESLQKGLRSLEIGAIGLGSNFRAALPSREDLMGKLRTPNSRRMFAIRQAMLVGFTLEELHEITLIDPWFLRQIKEIVDMEGQIRDFALANSMTPDNPEMVAVLRKAKEFGFSDRQLAEMWKKPEGDIRALRRETGTVPTYYLVDTCAAEFEAYTPYFYSTYETGQEVVPADRKKVIILGGGPNRIGQGIEFDYCCCHASFALKDAGVQAIMVNSNPETVSTDYDTSDRLYFEPLTFEDVMHIVEKERPDGVIVQFGGQTPLNLANALEAHGVPIIGTSPKAIDLAEDREHFSALLRELGLKQAEAGTATNVEDAAAIAGRIGYPVLLRPSFVLGGRGMIIVYEEKELRQYMSEAVEASEERPVLIDRFLENAVEIDVDVIADRERAVIGAIMQHVEPAGIHSGDSASMIPAMGISMKMHKEITRASKELARRLNVCGLMNIQFAVKDEQLYVIEVNPRASRTVPFVSKAIGKPLAKMAAQIMAGKTLAELGFTQEITPEYHCVKEAVFPWGRFPGIDVVLGPEMKSTGEVMGIDPDPDIAFAKSQVSAFNPLPTEGKVFISVNDRDKERVLHMARQLADMGFTLCATRGTMIHLLQHDIECERAYKVNEARRPNIVDHIKNGDIDFIINTPGSHDARADDIIIRSSAIAAKTSYCTNLASAQACVNAIEALKNRNLQVCTIQEYHAQTL